MIYLVLIGLTWKVLKQIMWHSLFPKKNLTTGLIAGIATVGAMVALFSHAGAVPPQREVAWLTQLAASRDPGAELQLGLAYRDGRYGLVPDQQASLHWLTAAGRDGDAYAADLVANSYAIGQGVKPSPQKAVHWWKVAATEGNADAETRLGETLLTEGHNKRALNWIRDAADRGSRRAHADLTDLYHTGNLSDDDLHRGENQVAALCKRLDATGLDAVFTAWHTLEDYTPILPWDSTLVSRASGGDPLAEYQLAMRYRDGSWGVRRDPRQAMIWLQRAATAGNHLAAHALDEMRHSGTVEPAPQPPAGAAHSNT